MRTAVHARRTRSTAVAAGLAGAVALALPGSAVAHDKFDHPAFAQTTQAPLSSAVNAGGRGAEWELVTTVPTGNPQTDLDFFTQGGEVYGAFGTLAAGPNGGGQSIVQLTQTDEEGVRDVDPSFLTAHPSAFCPTNPRSATGLQHDVEATPKGETISASYDVPFKADAQLLLDATDGIGRCHDQGELGISGAPQGGLEIIDITDIENPVEIGLTSHIGQAHTVNVDPKRPHIAFAVTSDTVSVGADADDLDGDGDVEELIRLNEVPEGADRNDLDGFEVVDISSCMNVNDRATFAPDATVEEKREGCRPVVYRYRYDSLDVALGHTNLETVFGCHELEIYPNDKLTCGSGGAGIVFDLSDAFDDMGTPNDFTDDTPKGTPLPCTVRPSSSATTGTGAMITDCVDGAGEGVQDLDVPTWLASGAPSLTGVVRDGSIYHQGRDVTDPAIGQPFPATEDIDFNHEMEFTQSGNFLLATDERGGGILGGAQCAASNPADNTNGGVSAYPVDALRTDRPESAEEAQAAYARGTDGEKALFRAPVRTVGEPTFCTAHVMQQIPGQNRIFMGWYTQGTQVIDYVELPGGRLEFVEDAAAQEASEATEDQPAVSAQAETEQAGYFIPEGANQWVSHIFATEENEDGTFTYFGATSDIERAAVDVYKVTLPAPADACTLAPQSTVEDRETAREVHRPSIDCVLHYDIAKGTSDTTYSPVNDVTRAQMASFVANAIEAAGGTLPAASGSFNDIAGSTHEENIKRLAAAQIVGGKGDGSYGPDENVTREQMASFIVRAARFVTGEAYAASATNSFSDVEASNVHRDNINAGFEAGLFQGTTAPTEGAPGMYSPKLSVQRDQMATFLVRLFTQTIQP